MMNTYQTVKAYLKIDNLSADEGTCNKNYPVTSMVLYFFTFSFAGWVWEVLVHLYLDRMFVNRGVLLGPWVPVYGVGGILVIFLLKRFQNNPGKIFIYTMVICGTVEYFTGLLLEKLYHMRWWDYSDSLINIQGRVCLEGLVFFGIGGLFFIYAAAPKLHHLYQKLTRGSRVCICIALISVFVFDVVTSYHAPNIGFGITF